MTLAGIPVDWMELPVRAVNALKLEGVSTLGEVDALRDSELLRIPNFGRKSLAELRDEVDCLRKQYHCGYGDNVLLTRAMIEARRSA